MTPEEFIKEYTRNCSNETGGWTDGDYIQIYHPWLTPDQALRAVELAREEMIAKTCEFLETYPHMFFGMLRSDMIEDFKKYMKE